MFSRVTAMSAESAVRRLQLLTGALSGRHGGHRIVYLSTSSKDGKEVSIGDVSIEIKTPRNPELVPAKYLPDDVPQAVLKDLRWIMQKDVLGQDVFLIGAPGPGRRTLAMMYSELTKKEVEYVSLSRDTTETDLKQRREISKGTAFHIDQCAVKAATEGRVLILEGIEKAERNVLPVLNNLLENREIQLDDGRFLMAAGRYDKLLKDHSKEELDKWKLVRVDESFRVIALGLPVPRYQGNPLDPPLRSRFQARDIHPLPFKDHIDLLSAIGGGVAPEKVTSMLQFASTMKSEEATGMGLQDFPMDNLHSLIKILETIPESSPKRLLSRLYPDTAMLNKEGRAAVADAFKSFEITEGENAGTSVINEVRLGQNGAAVQIGINGRNRGIEVNRGTQQETSWAQNFVATRYHDELLSDMLQSHMVHDFCLIGPRGCGKTMLANQFADLLGYHIEPIMLYQDMTSRDLLQQRSTKPNGDTSWRFSPLVTAALEGSLAILDGVHRVNAGTFAVLHRLIHDRELSLFDGTRLLRHDRYNKIKEEQSLSDEDMTERGIMKIHPSFRIMALSEPPQLGSSSGQWLSSELLTMFMFHHMRGLSEQEELQVLSRLVPNLSHMEPVMALAHKLRDSSDSNLKSVADSLSTRQLLRIARRLAKDTNEDLYETVQKACLGRFLPRLARQALDDELEGMGIKKLPVPASIEGIDKALSCEIKDGLLRIGSTTVPVRDTHKKMKVPDVLFYENPQHLAVMEDMLKDYLLGEHLLLVGNQGVGKNKIIDRFLYLLNRPREYLQLHRDTTVQTLTLQPTVQDGIILYEDSPLVRAVKQGHILVVDEADKAPTAVTCILKTLVESGEMHLADGRRIVSSHSGIPASESVIVAHPDFRMFVLANRPGFPFLGNDFFGAMGDIFSAHAIDNPDVESEMSMLRQYGPDVKEDILRKLVLAFGELRDMADQGLINYPYSTREVVNMVKHLQKYPTEGLTTVIDNVFDFDRYNKEMTETVVETLHKHGIPVGANPRNVQLAKEFPLPEFTTLGQWNIKRQGDRLKTGLLSCPVDDKKISIKGPVRMGVHSYPLERTEARSLAFTEQEAYWQVPLHETSQVIEVAVTKGTNRQPGQLNDDIIHMVTANPICLYTMNPKKQHLSGIDLYDIFPSASLHRQSYRPRVHIAPLGFPLDSNIIVHEEVSNITLNINWETGDLTRLDMKSMMDAATQKIASNFKSMQGSFRMNSQFAHEGDGFLLFYKQDGDTIDQLHMLEGRCHTISVPVKVGNVHMASRYDWIITEANTEKKYMLSHTKEKPFDYFLQFIEDGVQNTENDIMGDIHLIPGTPLGDAHLSAAVGHNIQSPNRLIASKDCYVSLAVGLPELSTVDIQAIPRREDEASSFGDAFRSTMTKSPGRLKANEPVQYLPESSQLVRAIPTWQAPTECYPDGQRPRNLAGYLEVTDVVHKSLRYVPVPGMSGQYYDQYFNKGTDTTVSLASMSNDGLVTVDVGGCVRLWETALFNLDKSIGKWRDMIGGEQGELKINERDLDGKVPDGPKHGQVDPSGAPHVGGGNWAGGTGGMNTAGMGGVGGPYRLDTGQGHEVFQVSQMDKDNVPEEVKRAAREMGQNAWRERLKQIKMSEFDADLYDKYADSVKGQIKSLRVILESLQAKGKERQWLKHQAYGDLDEAKLIEGLTGEKAIYKRRGEREPEMGTPQQKPKLVRLLCDVSGSMYRFNGYDGRMERELEAMLMVMESFEKYEEKINYDIFGHSGEGYNFDFVKAGKPPKNNKERLDILKTIHAHSQFCISGDHTVEAAEHHIKKVAEEEADEHFVIVLSDANLDRYGIRPKRFADVLSANEDVNAYVIFIGSLGDQASRILKQMPSGRAFICMDTKNLPQILQQIFTSTMLSTR